MLYDFFKLNRPFNVVATANDFLDLLERADALRDLLVQPDVLAPAPPRNRIRDKLFTNVSFSKKDIRGVDFIRCSFVDCLFIDTHFDTCTFHDCSFRGCNPYKVRFTSCYIDPAAFERTLNPNLHSNIGVGLFQELIRNSANTHQPDFFQSAQYLFRKWQCYQYLHEFKRKQLPFAKFIAKWLPSFLYDHLAGYGIRLFPFVRLTAVLILVLTAVNYFLWSRYSFGVDSTPPEGVSFLTSLYYTIATMTSLGLSNPGPQSPLGRIMSGTLVVVGVVWFAFLASMIVKRVLR